MSRNHVFDLSKLVATWSALFLAINWNAVAAFLTCVFTLLMILDKLGVLSPVKGATSRAWTRLWGRATP